LNRMSLSLNELARRQGVAADDLFQPVQYALETASELTPPPNTTPAEEAPRTPGPPSSTAPRQTSPEPEPRLATKTPRQPRSLHEMLLAAGSLQSDGSSTGEVGGSPLLPTSRSQLERRLMAITPDEFDSLTLESAAIILPIVSEWTHQAASDARLAARAGSMPRSWPPDKLVFALVYLTELRAKFPHLLPSSGTRSAVRAVLASLQSIVRLNGGQLTCLTSDAVSADDVRGLLDSLQEL
jgi:hypothetical protein